jgi:hypothetical protein
MGVFRNIEEEKSRALAVAKASTTCKKEYASLIACKKGPSPSEYVVLRSLLRDVCCLLSAFCLSLSDVFCHLLPAVC